MNLKLLEVAEQEAMLFLAPAGGCKDRAAGCGLGPR